MKALDTNVLIRAIANDDPSESPKAQKLLNEPDQFFISDIVFCEVVWVLRGKTYRQSRVQVANVLNQILNTDSFVFKDKDLLRSALKAYASGEADFADHFIAADARQAGCASGLTYDHTLSHDDPFFNSLP